MTITPIAKWYPNQVDRSVVAMVVEVSWTSEVPIVTAAQLGMASVWGVTPGGDSGGTFSRMLATDWYQSSIQLVTTTTATGTLTPIGTNTSATVRFMVFGKPLAA